MAATKEEVEEMFRAAGFAVNGDWEAKEEQELGIPKVLKESGKILKATKTLLDQQIANDVKSISDAQVALSRLKFGGGS